MNIILILFFSLITLTIPAFSHGSKDDCSNECNDYYCPPEMKKDKEEKFS